MAIEPDLSFFKKIRKGVIFFGNSNLNGLVNILIYKTKVCFFGANFRIMTTKKNPMQIVWRPYGHWN